MDGTTGAQDLAGDADSSTAPDELASIMDPDAATDDVEQSTGEPAEEVEDGMATSEILDEGWRFRCTHPKCAGENSPRFFGGPFAAASHVAKEHREARLDLKTLAVTCGVCPAAKAMRWPCDLRRHVGGRKHRDRWVKAGRPAHSGIQPLTLPHFILEPGDAEEPSPHRRALSRDHGGSRSASPQTPARVVILADPRGQSSPTVQKAQGMGEAQLEEVVDSIDLTVDTTDEPAKPDRSQVAVKGRKAAAHNGPSPSPAATQVVHTLASYGALPPPPSDIKIRRKGHSVTNDIPTTLTLSPVTSTPATSSTPPATPVDRRAPPRDDVMKSVSSSSPWATPDSDGSSRLKRWRDMELEARSMVQREQELERQAEEISAARAQHDIDRQRLEQLEQALSAAVEDKKMAEDAARRGVDEAGRAQKELATCRGTEQRLRTERDKAREEGKRLREENEHLRVAAAATAQEPADTIELDEVHAQLQKNRDELDQLRAEKLIDEVELDKMVCQRVEDKKRITLLTAEVMRLRSELDSAAAGPSHQDDFASTLADAKRAEHQELLQQHEEVQRKLAQADLQCRELRQQLEQSNSEQQTMAETLERLRHEQDALVLHPEDHAPDPSTEVSAAIMALNRTVNQLSERVGGMDDRLAEQTTHGTRMADELADLRGRVRDRSRNEEPGRRGSGEEQVIQSSTTRSITEGRRDDVNEGERGRPGVLRERGNAGRVERGQGGRASGRAAPPPPPPKRTRHH